MDLERKTGEIFSFAGSRLSESLTIAASKVRVIADQGKSARETFVGLILCAACLIGDSVEDATYYLRGKSSDRLDLDN